MNKKTLKILNLNIHNYHDFEERKIKIVNLIKRYDPEIITFQEVRDDWSKNKPEFDQAKQLNEFLNYKYSCFIHIMDVNKVKKLENKLPSFEGSAILSKYPFDYEGIKLKKAEGDKHDRKILKAKFNIENEEIEMFVVHFSCSDFFATLHSKETMEFAKEKKPIIIGDFNIKYPEEIRELAKLNNYKSSLIYDYISFPNDNCSYDYVFIPPKYNFLEFVCDLEKVSDHRALFVKIKL